MITAQQCVQAEVASLHHASRAQLGRCLEACRSSQCQMVDDPGQPELLARLGKHRMGKSCLYLKRLADLDVNVLEALVAGSVAEAKRRHG